MTVDHEFTHNMIAGMSFTKEGRTLVENLEAMRYYHRDGKSFYLGDGARLIVSYNESPEYMEDNKIIGALYLPGNKNGKPGHEHLFIDEACYLGDKIEAALYWSFPKDMDEVWEPIMNRPEYQGASCISAGYVVQQLMRTAHAPVLVPYELAEWASELIVDNSDWEEIPVDQCRPVWREVIVKYPDDDDNFIRTLIKVPSEELDLYLTTLDEDLEKVRAIPVTSDHPRVLFARKLNQERRIWREGKYHSAGIIRTLFAEWELMLLDGNMTRWEADIQELSEGYCVFTHMGNGVMMRDLINTARTIEHVRSHELDRLREAIGLDEQRQKRIVFDITSTMVSELLVRMKKILNLVTNYQNQEYFDNVSPVQALVHLVMDDYSPHDIKF